MKNYLLFVLFLMSMTGFSACAPKRFDRIEQIENVRYGIAYKEGKCGIYDYAAVYIIKDIDYRLLMKKLGMKTISGGH